MDITTTTDNLWSYIEHGDRSVASSDGKVVSIARADGAVVRVPADQFAQLVAAHETLRLAASMVDVLAEQARKRAAQP